MFVYTFSARGAAVCEIEMELESTGIHGLQVDSVYVHSKN